MRVKVHEGRTVLSEYGVCLSVILFFFSPRQNLSSTLTESRKFASCMNICSVSWRFDLFTTFLNVVSSSSVYVSLYLKSLCHACLVRRAHIYIVPSVMSAENPSEPFGASVIIDGVTYGTGTASSKKLAKNKAGNSFYWQHSALGRVDLEHSLSSLWHLL